MGLQMKKILYSIMAFSLLCLVMSFIHAMSEPGLLGKWHCDTPKESNDAIFTADGKLIVFNKAILNKLGEFRQYPDTDIYLYEVNTDLTPKQINVYDFDEELGTKTSKQSGIYKCIDKNEVRIKISDFTNKRPSNFTEQTKDEHIFILKKIK